VTTEGDVFSRLVRLARILRSKEGCPWDRAQDLASLARCVMAEAHEVQEAVSHDDGDHVREEIGDVLFTLISMAVLAEERGTFSMVRLLEDLEAKMVRRHPHVFGNASAQTVGEALQRWNEVKSSEQQRKLESDRSGDLS